MMLRNQIICMDEVKEIYVPQIKILAFKSWYLLVMGHRFEITIDYRFRIGKTKPTSYR